MPNIYLKVTIDKNWRSQNLDLKKKKNFSAGEFLWSFNSRRYHWIFKFLVTS